MRVFVTGATGYVGAAVVQELIRAGHQVRGLSRSEKGDEALRAAGAEAYRGDTTDLDSLRQGMEDCDAVIHTAFNHDFIKLKENAATSFKESAEADRRTIRAMGAALAGTSRPLVVTSALAVLPTGRLATEHDRAAAGSPNPRVASEEAADAVAATGVRVAVVRLPPSVHGPGDGHGFVPILIRIARAQGVSAYQGDGANTWPAAHLLDVARLYQLAVTHEFTSGARFHAVAEPGICLRDIAERIGQQLRLPVASRSGEEAQVHFGSFAYFAGLNTQASSEWTRQQLNWQPTHPGLLADLDSGSYFAG
ncbi:MAG: SDR family oxidoreductase [Cytophagaceae bacterium]|nr:MAG: SDR family oxidoreductase [Cytophagaceae bacterium]